MANITETEIIELITKTCKTAHLIGSRVEFGGRFATENSDWDILIENKEDFARAKSILDWWTQYDFTTETVVVKERRGEPVYDERAMRYQGVKRVLRYKPILVDIEKEVRVKNKNSIDLVHGVYLEDAKEREKLFIRNHIEQFVDCSVRGLRAWALDNIEKVLEDYNQHTW